MKRYLFLIACFAGVMQTARSAVAGPSNIPDRVFSIVKYGAVGDGKTINTDAINKTIQACKDAGGGEILIPDGKFVTGPLKFISNMNLHVEGTLLLDDDIANYPMVKERYIDGFRWDKCHDIEITGHGTIDGQGQAWWPKYRKVNGVPPKLPHRPFMVVIHDCQHVLIEDVTFENSPMFHLVPQGCEDVTIRNIYIHAPSDTPNTDALDPSGHDFTITNCKFDVGDDNIALKPSGHELSPSCENFHISNCTFLHGHGMSVGGQTPGGLKNMTVENCTFDSTDFGIRLKADRGHGGLVEDLTYKNLTMKNVREALRITSWYPHIPKNPADEKAQPVTDTTPIWRNIRISNVTATGCETAVEIAGLPEAPVEDVVLTNVKISADHGVTISNAKGIKFVNSQVTAKKGPVLTKYNAEVTGLSEN